MKRRWFFNVVLVLGLLLAVVVGQNKAQGPALGDDSQANGFTLHNRQLGLVQPNQSATVSESNLENLALEQKQVYEPLVSGRPFGLLNYQGLLVKDGNPFNGSINITFRLYTADTGGGAWWQETQSVQVNEGLFNVMLGAVTPLDDTAVNFQNQQWLGVQPAGAASELTPRQPLGTVAYAMNLMPGATMADDNAGGPYAYSFYVSADNHSAIYGSSDSGTGITGYTSADNAPGVYGGAGGTSNESHGLEGRMSGDTGSCSSTTTECGSGIYATASGNAYASFFYGQHRSGIIDLQGNNTYYGLWVYSLIAPNGNGIYTNGASYFTDYVTFSAGKSGYVVDIALNDGSESLEKGDVVVISGYDTPVVGNIPVMRVQKAAEANATGVIGVVDVLYVPCGAEEPLEAGQVCGGFENDVTTIQPGAYLSVVTLGAYEAVKVDASSGSIRPGDILATSSSRGHAMKATPVKVQGMSFHAPGTIIGKALGRLNSGTGTIPVFVSSR